MDVVSARRVGVELFEELVVTVVDDTPEFPEGDCSGMSSEPIHIAWESPALLILKRHSSPLDWSFNRGG